MISIEMVEIIVVITSLFRMHFWWWKIEKLLNISELPWFEDVVLLARSIHLQHNSLEPWQKLAQILEWHQHQHNQFHFLELNCLHWCHHHHCPIKLKRINTICTFLCTYVIILKGTIEKFQHWMSNSPPNIFLGFDFDYGNTSCGVFNVRIQN